MLGDHLNNMCYDEFTQHYVDNNTFNVMINIGGDKKEVVGSSYFTCRKLPLISLGYEI